MSINNEIRSIALEHGLKVPELASILRVAPSTVYAWLSGGRQAPAMALELLKLKLIEK